MSIISFTRLKKLRLNLRLSSNRSIIPISKQTSKLCITLFQILKSDQSLDLPVACMAIPKQCFH